MKTPLKDRTPLLLLHRITALVLLMTFPVSLFADELKGPRWWYNESALKRIVDPNAEAENKAAANVGQAKWVALRALEELEAELPAVGAQVRVTLVGIPAQNGNPAVAGIFDSSSPATDAEREAQKAPLLVGQLKSIAKPFYDALALHAPWWSHNRRLENQTLNAGSIRYPWDEAAPVAGNRAIANVGQLKAVFALDFHLDQDGNGFSDLREEALAGTDDDADGIPDGTDPYPGDRFNGKEPLLLVAGEWTVESRKRDGSKAPGVGLQFRKWPAAASAPDTAVFTTGTTDSDGRFQLNPTGITPGDRVVVNMTGSLHQKVYLPWKNGTVAGDTAIAPGGTGWTSSGLQVSVDGAGGTGQDPDLLGSPGGVSPGGGGPGGSYKQCSLSDFTDLESTTIEQVAPAFLSKIVSTYKGQGPEASQSIYNLKVYENGVLQTEQDTLNNPPYFGPGHQLGIGAHLATQGPNNDPDRHDVTRSMILRGKFGGKPGQIPLRWNFFNHDIHNTWYTYGLSEPYVSKFTPGPAAVEFNLTDQSSSTVDGTNFPPDETIISQISSDIKAMVSGDPPLVGSASGHYQQYIILGPVPVKVPEEVLFGGPFYFREFSEVEVPVELPFGYLVPENYEAAIQWTAAITDGEEHCRLILNDPVGNAGIGQAVPGQAATWRIDEGKHVVKLGFAALENAPPLHNEDQVVVHISASLRYRPEGTTTYLLSPLGSYDLTLEYALPDGLAEDASVRQAAQLKGALSGEGDVRAPESSAYVGGQRTQTLEPERRVGLDGLPDAPGSTFVDAMTRRFHHGESDFQLPIPGSDLALMVQRGAAESIWTKASGLRPNEDPLLPFGPGWSSNLAASVRIDTVVPKPGDTSTPPSISGPVAVVDYTGQSWRFTAKADGTFVADPTLLPDRDSTNISLVKEAVTGDLILTQPLLNIVHRYKNCGLAVNVPENRDEPSGSRTIRSAYYHLDSVTDRFNTKLRWEYTGTQAKIVPDRIYVEGRSAFQLRFQQGSGSDAGRVVSFWDPSGIKYGFHYSAETDGSGQRVLDRSEVGSRVKLHYGYKFQTEADPRPQQILLPLQGGTGFYRIPTLHLALDEISNELAQKSTIHYNLSTSRMAYSAAASAYYSVAGDPMVVSSIDLPLPGRSVSFGGTHVLKPAAGSTPAAMSLTTQVTDIWNHHWNYVWDSPQEFNWSPSPSVPAADLIKVGRASALFFPGLTRSCTELANSQLIYTYDPRAGFARMKMEDASGRKDTATYELLSGQSANPLYVAPTVSVGGGAAVPIHSRADSATAATNPLGLTSTYTYTTGQRLPKTRKDHRGRISEVVYDTTFVRPLSFKTWDGESGGSFTGLLTETSLAYHATLPGVLVKRTVKNSGLFTAGQPAWVTDLVTTTQIDSAGLGWPERVGYDANGDGVLGQAGDLYTEVTNTPSGRVIAVRKPNGGTSSMLFDSAGMQTETVFEDGSSMYFEYDKAGRQVLTRDALDNRVGTVYDEMGRVVKSIHDNDHELTFDPVSSTFSNPSTSQDVISSVLFDDANGRLQMTDPRGFVRVTQFDPLRRVAKWIAPKPDRSRGYVPTAEADDVTTVARAATDPLGPPITVTDPLGYETKFIYDSQSRLEKTLKRYSSTGGGLYQGVFYGYDADLRTTVSQVRTPLNSSGGPAVGGETLKLVTSKTEYDRLDRAFQVTQAFGTPREIRTRLAHTATGLLWSAKSRDNIAADRWVEVQSEFDALGRPVKAIMPEVPDENNVNRRPTTEVFYDSAGDPTLFKDARGHFKTIGYDVRGQVSFVRGERVRDASSGLWQEPVSHYRYDAVGRLLESRDPRGNSREFVWDGVGRLRKALGPEMDPDFPTAGRALTEYIPNPAGEDRIVDVEGNTTYFDYDARGMLRRTRAAVSDYDQNGVITPAEIVQESTHDALGRVTRVEDGKDQATAFTYDGLGRKLTQTWDPGTSRAKTETTAYDALLPTGYVDGKQTNFSYLYDERFMLQEVNVTGKPQETVLYGRDDLGRPTSVQIPNAPAGMGDPNLGYSYDPLGRVSSETSNGITHQYRYEVGGGVAWAKNGASGRELITRRDAMGRVTDLDDVLNGVTRTTSFGYDLAGNRVEEKMASGLEVSSSYDRMNRLVSQRLHTASKAAICRNDLQWDLRGNMVAAYESTKPFDIPDRTLSMGYDERNRLVMEMQSGAGLPSEVKRHRYDLADNRIGVYTTSGTEKEDRVYTYGGGLNSNQLSTSAVRKTTNGTYGAWATTYYGYDDNGNRLYTSAGVSYVYDSFNRLTGYHNYSGTENGSTLYAYDPAGRRIARKAEVPYQPQPRLFSFQGYSPVQEWTPGSGTSLVDPVENIGGGVGGRLYSYQGGSATFDLHNSRGDVVGQSTDGGTLNYRALPNSDGKVVKQSGTRVGNYGANSKWEEAAGLINDGFRYRDRDSGTYLSRDPAGFVDGLNVYNYVRHNPWSFFDPNGLDSVPAGTESSGYFPPGSDPIPMGPVVENGQAMFQYSVLNSGSQAGRFFQGLAESMWGGGDRTVVTVPANPEQLAIHFIKTPAGMEIRDLADRLRRKQAMERDAIILKLEEIDPYLDGCAVVGSSAILLPLAPLAIEGGWAVYFWALGNPGTAVTTAETVIVTVGGLNGMDGYPNMGSPAANAVEEAAELASKSKSVLGTIGTVADDLAREAEKVAPHVDDLAPVMSHGDEIAEEVAHASSGGGVPANAGGGVPANVGGGGSGGGVPAKAGGGGGGGVPPNVGSQMDEAAEIIAPSVDDIVRANQTVASGRTLTGEVDTVLANMAYRDGLYDKTATAIRDIAGRHLFQDGNKRTAQAIAEQMMKANGGTATPELIRSVVDRVGKGELKSVEEISAALRGAN